MEPLQGPDRELPVPERRVKLPDGSDVSFEGVRLQGRFEELERFGEEAPREGKELRVLVALVDGEDALCELVEVAPGGRPLAR